MATSQHDVYRQLKQSITNFEFRPGARLVEDDLSARYGVSRTPVREALRQLEREGLVVASAGRGRLVRDISLRDYEDVSRVRLALEELAVAQACDRAKDEAVDELRQSWDGTRDAPADGSYVFADERFHSGVAQLSNNEFLVDELARVNDRIRIIRLTDFTDEQRIKTVREEHDAILAAILARDCDHATALMRSHIERSHANVRQLIGRALERAYLDSPKELR
jgi:DNA-binding GntR family transcriptional regulator